MTTKVLLRAKHAAILTGLSLFLPGLAMGQTSYGQPQAIPGQQMTSAPLDSSSGGIAALAPQADRLQGAPVGDRTPNSKRPPSREPDADIGLSAAPSAADTPQDAATVLADNLVLANDQTLTAAGGVVIWYQGRRLVASRLIVDGPSGALTIEGPVHLSKPGAENPDEEAILIAESAQLDRKLQNGIIRGARLILAREMQLAAQSATRTGEGRFTRLSRVAASSCRICSGNPTPLWEIRAQSITHDAQERDFHFERPQLRAFGLPIAYAPFTVTAPDPTVERRDGFLRPGFRTTSNLGFGIKLPYFKTLGDHADITITPYLSVERTSTLELRYRQAFRNGAMQLDGAVSRDDIRPGKTRGYLFGNAQFLMPRDYRLGVQVQLASDRGYLLDYGITNADRLWSGVTLERVRRDKLVFARAGNYRSLRGDTEDNKTSPVQVADATWLRRFQPRLIGGEGWLEWSVHAHRRPSDQDVAGRDVVRGSVGFDWRRSEILQGGVVASAILGLDADLYRIAQDSTYDDVAFRANPVAGVELRWPLAGHSDGATHLVEPVAQILWSSSGGDGHIPNEDSRLIEFDEGNLFADSRFPGADARETGLRTNLGLSWTRIDPTGWSVGLTAGRVFRAHSERQFGENSPLGGRNSDWLLAANFDSTFGIAVANRALFDDSFKISRNEFRLGWSRDDAQLSLGHLWIDSDRTESRLRDTSEMTADLGWQIAPGWWGNAETRYDFNADQAQKASLDLTYSNECVNLEFGVSRRFTDSVSVRPETSFDLSVRLGGFGRQSGGPGTVARQSCMR